MTKQEIYVELKKLWESFDTNHNKTTKKSDADARKALGEVKKLITPYLLNILVGLPCEATYIIAFGTFKVLSQA